jgi:hypothetical protein
MLLLDKVFLLMDELFLNRDSKGRIEGRNNEFKKQT